MSKNTKTILIIEDEEDLREVYTEIIEDSGYKVVSAKDGVEGLEYALEGKWDLLLLDIMLPKIDGLKILEEVRGQKREASKPIILLTNLGRESVIKKGFSLGADGYIIKSEVTPDQIVNEVEKFIGSMD